MVAFIHLYRKINLKVVYIILKKTLFANEDFLSSQNTMKLEWEKVQSHENELAHYIVQFAKKTDEPVVLFEDVLSRLTDPRIDFFQEYGFSIDQRMYYFLREQQLDQSVVQRAILESEVSWHFLCVLFSGKNLVKDVINSLTFREVLQEVRLIITNAYDGEGYLFWEPRGKLV